MDPHSLLIEKLDKISNSLNKDKINTIQEYLEELESNVNLLKTTISKLSD